MNKSEFIEKLQNYKPSVGKRDEIQRKINKLEKEIEDIKNNVDIKITANYEMGGKSNVISSKVENTAIKREEKIKLHEEELAILKRTWFSYNDMVSEIENYFKVVTELEKKMIIDRYCEERSYEYIGNNTYLEATDQTRSSKRIEQLINRAIEKILKIF